MPDLALGDDLRAFVDASPSPFHAVAELARRLRAAGFAELTEADAWWVKTKVNPDGTTTRRALVHVAGGPEYRKFCDEVAEAGYAGFELK